MDYILKLFWISFFILFYSNTSFSQPMAKTWEEKMQDREESFKKFDQKIEEGEKRLQEEVDRIILKMMNNDKKKADEFYHYLIQQEAEALKKIEKKNKDKDYFKLGKSKIDLFLVEKESEGVKVLRSRDRKEIFKRIKEKKITTVEQVFENFKISAKKKKASGGVREKKGKGEEEKEVKDTSTKNEEVEVKEEVSIEVPGQDKESVAQNKTSPKESFPWRIFLVILTLLVSGVLFLKRIRK